MRDNWFELESVLNSCSLGVVYHSGPRSDEITALLREGLVGAPLPGAIAVLGCDIALLRWLTKICEANPRPYTERTGSQPYIAFEWPPILMVASVRDSSLSEAIQAVSDLRDLHIPIEIAALPDLEDAFLPRAHETVRGFFQANLIRHFPRMF
jgi:hypothetical protein